VGFLKVLNERTIGFADFRGNRQYVSVGNLGHDDRVAMILVDYPTRTRLKILGHARIVDSEDAETLSRLVVPGYRAKVERGIVVDVVAFDWNCSQHITPRYTAEEIEVMVAQREPLGAAVERTAAASFLTGSFQSGRMKWQV
jgi:predicted pyridoxine 5'-phosphate oxidase superfamily flavin-nucleotide-binding protein